MENGFDKDLEDFLSKPVLTSNIGQLQDNSQPTNGTNAPERRQETTVYNNNNNYRGSNVRGTYHNRSYGNVSHDGQWRTLRYQQDCLKQAESVFLQTKSEWEAKATVFQQNFKNQREDLKLKATSLELVESSLKEEQKKNEEKFATLIRAERTGRVATLWFLTSSNMEVTREPFVKYICERLTKEIIDSKREKDLPFTTTATSDDKEKILIEFMDILQTGLPDKLSTTNKNVNRLLNSSAFLYQPSDEKKKEMKEKIDMDGIVGTIHTMILTSQTTPYFLYFAIVDKRIVGLSFARTNIDAITKLDTKIQPKWSQDYKFAIDPKDCSQKDISPLFVQTNKKEIYQENGKVITWIFNNFKKLKPIVQKSLEGSVAAIYNLSIDCLNEKDV